MSASARIELGRALAMQPELLLLDEPVAGMNTEETEDMARFILDIRSELGLAIVMVEHDMRLVMDLADRVLVIDFGRQIALGTPREVQQDPAVIAAYLGQQREPADDQLPAVTTTRAQRALATWIAAVPMPPAAPCTSTVSPSCR